MITSDFIIFDKGLDLCPYCTVPSQKMKQPILRRLELYQNFPKFNENSVFDHVKLS